MARKLFAIYGASGYGRETLPLARAQLASQGINSNQLLFIDDHKSVENINGHYVESYEGFLARDATERYIALAIADSQTREKLAIRCNSDDVLPWSIKANNVTVLDGVSIGEGAILNPLVTLTSNIHIGKYFHANIYSYVAHDCIIGDFVTFAPGVKCNGNIVIEDHAYIGTGAILKQGKPNDPLIIGRGAIVGMGAVVTKSVAAGTTVVGNPAKPILKKA